MAPFSFVNTSLEFGPQSDEPVGPLVGPLVGRSALSQFIILCALRLRALPCAVSRHWRRLTQPLSTRAHCTLSSSASARRVPPWSSSSLTCTHHNAPARRKRPQFGNTTPLRSPVVPPPLLQVSFSPPHLRKSAAQALFHLCSTPALALAAVDSGLLEPLVVSTPDPPAPTSQPPPSPAASKATVTAAAASDPSGPKQPGSSFRSTSGGVSSVDRAFVALLTRIVDVAPEPRTEAVKVGAVDRLLEVARLISDASPWTLEDGELLATCLSAARR